MRTDQREKRHARRTWCEVAVTRSRSMTMIVSEDAVYWHSLSERCICLYAGQFPLKTECIIHTVWTGCASGQAANAVGEDMEWRAPLDPTRRSDVPQRFVLAEVVRFVVCDKKRRAVSLRQLSFCLIWDWDLLLFFVTNKARHYKFGM